VLVNFYADWCGPCRRLAPVLEEVARDTPAAKIVRVNADQNRALAARYGVSSLPTLIVFKDGRVIAKQTGVVSKNRLKAMLDL
jgi:thioredoxin 1